MAAMEEKLALAQEQFRLDELELERKTGGIFHFHDCEEPIIFAKTSLFCMSDENGLRKLFVWLATWAHFDNFVTVMILLNSIMLASTDYEIRLNPLHVSTWTPI